MNGSVRCIAAKEGEGEGRKAFGSRTEIKVLQIFVHAGSENGLSDTEKICSDVLKRQRNNRFNQKNNKKAKAPEGTNSNCYRGCRLSGLLCKMCMKKKRNYLIHTNCMYSLVVNFDKEESSKWERTKKIQVTVRKNMVCNTEFRSGRVPEKNVTVDYGDCLNGNTQCVCTCVV